MLDFFEDEDESYFTFEAIKSKLTLEMIVYHKEETIAINKQESKDTVMKLLNQS